MNSHLVVTAYATVWTTFCALTPLFLASRLRQRRPVGWSYFAWGAIITALAYVARRAFIHTPVVQDLMVWTVSAAHVWTRPSQKAALRVLLALLNSLVSAISLLAGCWGISRTERSRWATVVMYGLGFGGAHMLLGTPIGRTGAWLSTLAHISVWTMARWIWDAGFDLAVDVAVSVLAFQGFQRRRALWLGYAVMLAVTGAVVPLLVGFCLTGVPWYLQFLVIAAVHSLFGLGGLWVITRWRDPATAPSVSGSRQSM